jgi:hypothetical protein
MNDKSLRDHLRNMLDWDNAHIRFDDAVKDFPRELRGRRPPGSPHSAWELLEHLRIALVDILEFSRDGRHVSPAFPEGYWPSSEAPLSDDAWDESVAGYRAALREFAELVADDGVDLFAAIPHGEGKTVLREVLLAVDHNAYHLGQLVMVRRLLGA